MLAAVSMLVMGALMCIAVVLQLRAVTKSREDERARCCGPGCRTTVASGAAVHYDPKYFAWQAGIGVAKAKTGNWMALLQPLSNDTVLDLGAGTGAILASLGSRVRRKVAVEFSDSAREYMRREHPEIIAYKYPEDVPDQSVSLIYSTSVIEHVECPIQELGELRRKLIPGGRIIVGIKNEGVEMWREWKSGNRDNHLWTWNSMLLGNTLRAAGFVVDHITSSGKSIDQVENYVVKNNFGRRGHTFQYIYAHGHARRVGEPWPQVNASAKLTLRSPPARRPVRVRPAALHGARAAARRRDDRRFGHAEPLRRATPLPRV